MNRNQHSWADYRERELLFHLTVKTMTRVDQSRPRRLSRHCNARTANEKDVLPKSLTSLRFGRVADGLPRHPDRVQTLKTGPSTPENPHIKRIEASETSTTPFRVNAETFRGFKHPAEVHLNRLLGSPKERSDVHHSRESIPAHTHPRSRLSSCRPLTSCTPTPETAPVSPVVTHKN